jgi:hypothetical protein
MSLAPDVDESPGVDEARDRERIATRLLAASVRRSYDADVDLDWDAEMPEDMYHWPPERISLYGTPLWDGLTPRQRIDLSQHEVASMASVGIWFEIIALQLLARYVYPLDPRDKHVQYALTEMADECRHTVMFARSVERGGAPVYRPGRLASLLGRMMGHTAWGPSMLAVILVAEDITDTFQREVMADERLQPLVRGVSRIHVVEEARHLQYARAEVLRMWADTNRLSRGVHRLMIAVSAFFVARSLINPGVYEAVGLPRRRARRAALRNPHYAATLRWSGERVTTFLADAGMLGGVSKLIWRRAGLL